MAEIRRQPIKINMLGAFSMEYDGNVLTDEKSRTKQVWLLLKYLLTNRHREVTTEELVDILWEDGIDNPNNALKNLVYRLRNLLDAVGRGENGEYIINKRGICRW
ncbi:MAG: helix-turn-helix domain-containing protein, partial [Clostridia bacterium]|nr:helix-turn-helix domain-containing protein [Clostridia bacterium]